MEDQLAGFEPWSADRARAVVAAHAGLDGATLPILHALQAVFGCISLDAEPLIATALNISRAEVHGIVSFYHDFRRSPPGRHILKLCRAEACQAVGGTTVAEHTRRLLAVDWNETSADGAVTLQPVFCLGLCAAGPAALLDGAPAVRLDASGIDRMLEQLS